MENGWIFFALLAPLLWAIVNFVDKYSLREYAKGAHDFIFFGSLLGWVLFLVLSIVLGLPEVSLLWLPPIGLGMIFVGASWFYAKSLRISETSQLIISFKLIPVLTTLFAFLFLGQRFSGTQALAFVIVLAGVTLISVEKVEGALRITEGTKWIAGAILIWGAMFVGVDWALTKVSFWHFLTLEVLGKSIAGTSLLLVPQIREDLLVSVKRATIRKCFLFGLTKVFDFFGQVLIKKAFVLGTSAGLVTVVMQVQSVYGIIIGIGLTLWFPQVIKEDISKEHLGKKLFGTATMFAGLCLLVL